MTTQIQIDGPYYLFKNINKVKIYRFIILNIIQDPTLINILWEIIHINLIFKQIHQI